MNDGDEMQINMLKSQRDAAVATEQNIRAINNDLSRELAILREFHKNQCQVAMGVVPPESALTFIDPAQYLSAYIRVLQSELHKWRLRSDRDIEILRQEIFDWKALCEKGDKVIEAQQKRIAELEGELAKCHGNNLAGNPYEWSHQALIDGLGGQLTAEIAENLSLKDKVQELEENESGRYREVESLAARVEYIEIENDGLHKHIQELHSENAALKDRIRELEKALQV